MVLYYAVKRIMHDQCSFNAMDNAWENNALNGVSNAWFDLISSQPQPMLFCCSYKDNLHQKTLTIILPEFFIRYYS